MWSDKILPIVIAFWELALSHWEASPRKMFTEGSSSAQTFPWDFSRVCVKQYKTTCEWMINYVHKLGLFSCHRVSWNWKISSCFLELLEFTGFLLFRYNRKEHRLFGLQVSLVWQLKTPSIRSDPKIAKSIFTGSKSAMETSEQWVKFIQI